MMPKSIASRALLGAALFLPSACLSPAPSAPAVRHFDPLRSDDVRGSVAFSGSFVELYAEREVKIAVRVGAHELAFDGDHAWLRPPYELFAAALAEVGVGVTRGPAPPRQTAPPLRVYLQVFELDRRARPCARVRLTITRDGSELGTVSVTSDASADTIEALVAAAGVALREAASAVRERISVE